MQMGEWGTLGGPAKFFRPRSGRHRAAYTGHAWASLLATACAGAPTSTPATHPQSSAAIAAPKYAAFSLPLSREHTYFQRAIAPDFWALASYYVGQQNDAACSLASLTMLVNAARHTTALTSNEPLVTQTRLLERVRSDVWQRGLAPEGDGVTLDQLAELARQSLAAFGITPTRLETTHVPEASPDALERLRGLLRQNEASASDYLLLNFDARAYVGVGDYGHISPVGAYDAERQRVLVLDPDRAWYEPYWIPDTIALDGMATHDSVTGQPRGYLYVALH